MLVVPPEPDPNEPLHSYPVAFHEDQENETDPGVKLLPVMFGITGAPGAGGALVEAEPPSFARTYEDPERV